MTMAETYHNIILPLQPKLYRYALRMVKDEALASDVTQNVLERLWKMRDELEDIRNPEAWSMKMTRNECLTEFRYHHRFSDNGEADKPSGEDVFMQVSRENEMKWLDGVVASLKPDHQEVFHLREVELLPYEEIASITGLSLSNVKAIIHRTRKSIRDKMTKIHSYGT